MEYNKAMKLSEADVKKIKSYFASQKEVAAVYLYGSFSYGNPHGGSDLDIAVLFDGEVNLYERLGSLYSNFPKLSVHAEPEVRELDLNKSPVFLRNVLRGKCVFSRDDSKRIKFEVAVMQLFRDTEDLRNISNIYMKKRIREGTYGFRSPYIK